MMAKPPVTVRVIEAAPMLELLDPKRITVKNVREAKPDREFIESIRDLGNVQPIGVLQTPDNELVLRFGLQRLQACIETGRKVLAMVVDGTTGTDEAEIERIFLQLAENDRRTDLTSGERALAVATLFDLGVDTTEISRQTGLGKKDLAAVRKIAASETARTVAGQYPLDLEQTAAIAEFDDDLSVVHELADAAREGKGRFAHTLQRARDTRLDAKAIAAHAAKLEKRGITVTVERQHWDNLLSDWADGSGVQLTPETHLKCPGNLVVLSTSYGHKASESWYCADPKGNGHKRHRSSGTAGQSPEDAAAERKKVLAGNKAWRSAEKVRRAWLREFLSRPKAPDGALQFTLEAFAEGDGRLRRAMEHGSDGQHPTARELLGLPAGAGSSWSRSAEVWTAMKAASPARAQVIALAMVLGAFEGSTGVHSWRSPHAENAAYLEALAGWGYELSDIEQELVTAVRKREAKHAAVIRQDEAAAAEHETTSPDIDSGEGFSYLSCGHSIWDGVIREAGEPADCPSHGSVTVISQEQWMSEYGDEPDAGGVFVGRAVREGDDVADDTATTAEEPGDA